MKNIFNLYLISGVVCLVLGLLILFLRQDIAYMLDFGRRYESIMVISGILFVLVGVSLALYIYLQFNKKDIFIQYSDIIREKNTEVISSKIKAISEDQKNETIEKNIEELPVSDPLFDLIKKISNEDMLTLFNEKFGQSIENSIKVSKIDQHLTVLQQRINFEIARLTKSANVNLVFGTVVTALAVGILAYDVFTTKLTTLTLIIVLAHYIPRISIVVFVEIFAFFFLKIYKTNLSDIKYFHNELTNIEMKLASIKSAFVTNNETIIQFTVQELAKTERNFILKKDESTIELEKEKIDNFNNKNIADALKELVKLK
ncbi:hypothetical protein [Mucilaginibacter sp. OK098]|uniref:hypothetical protein n=1 Tax=Mucilaginibacter sp. OK098 TaxID=1855297 RepID=UPI00091C406B|nr:hypothetical protein [Mucilaginibacter sp. OK098]SHM13503.1 hypothetical protein SAMN05216524_101924 [Mucilaginibacter sp. OK098]